MADSELKKEYALSDTENEKKRLQEQSRIIMQTTRRIFELAGIEKGMKVLELGTGVGDVALLLAEMVGPEGEVVSIERNPEIQKTAKQRAEESGYKNIRFMVEDISAAEPEGEFEALVGRAVLMYVPRPEEVLKMLLRHVKPGGVVAFQEVDFTIRPVAIPPLPLFMKLWDLFYETMEKSGTEMQMGLTAYQEILKKSKITSDPKLNADLTRVGRRIADATGRTGYKWEFNVIDDQQVNAFALPGGKVGVYTGILPVTRDDAGLAAVLGHEVSHAIARHSGERVSQQIAVQVGVGAAQVMLAGYDPRLTRLGTLAFMGLATGGLLAFSRAQESEADHLGLIYMAKAGYHPVAARDLWVRMTQASKGARQPEFLSTHPSPETRLQQIEGWIPEALRHYSPR